MCFVVRTLGRADVFLYFKKLDWRNVLSFLNNFQVRNVLPQVKDFVLVNVLKIRKYLLNELAEKNNLNTTNVLHHKRTYKEIVYCTASRTSNLGMCFWLQKTCVK